MRCEFCDQTAVVEVTVEGRFAVAEWHPACATHREEHRAAYARHAERPIPVASNLQDDLLEHVRREGPVSFPELIAWRPRATVDDLARAVQRLQEGGMLVERHNGWVIPPIPKDREPSSTDIVLEDLRRHPWSAISDISVRTDLSTLAISSVVRHAGEQVIRDGVAYAVAGTPRPRVAGEPAVERPSGPESEPPLGEARESILRARHSSVKLRADLSDLVLKAGDVTLADVMGARPGVSAGDLRKALQELVVDGLLEHDKEARVWRWAKSKPAPPRVQNQEGAMSLRQRVEDGLHRWPGLTGTQLAEKLGADRTQVASYLSKMCKAGTAERRPTLEGAPSVYFLADSRASEKSSLPASSPAAGAPTSPPPAPSDAPPPVEAPAVLPTSAGASTSEAGASASDVTPGRIEEHVRAETERPPLGGFGGPPPAQHPADWGVADLPSSEEADGAERLGSFFSRWLDGRAWRILDDLPRSRVVLLHSSGLWTELDAALLLSLEEGRAIAHALEEGVRLEVAGRRVVQVQTRIVAELVDPS